jgi:hypothetical protein
VWTLEMGVATAPGCQCQCSRSASPLDLLEELLIKDQHLASS